MWGTSHCQSDGSLSKLYSSLLIIHSGSWLSCPEKAPVHETSAKYAHGICSAHPTEILSDVASTGIVHKDAACED